MLCIAFSLLSLLPIMLVASLDFGVTTDEQLRQLHGEAVVRVRQFGSS